MGSSHLHFQPDPSPDIDVAVAAWREAGGRPADAVERLVEVKAGRVGKRHGIFRLHGAGPAGTTVIAKRGDAPALSIEAVVFREVLPALSLPAPACHGYVEQGDVAWLFMDEIVGERFSARSPAHRACAVRWLAALHTGTSRLRLVDRFPDIGPERAVGCFRSARADVLAAVEMMSRDERKQADGLVAVLDDLEAAWGEVCERCATFPRCLVHGDFVKKNVFIAPHGGGHEVMAIDWETSGWGVPAADLEHVDEGAYFALIRPVWPHLRPTDVSFLKTVGIAIRHAGLVAEVSSCLRGEPAWTMERLAPSTAVLAAALQELRRTLILARA